jgi:hypothetical protein
MMAAFGRVKVPVIPVHISNDTKVDRIPDS